MKRASKLIGVLGGMGPAATAAFMQQVIRYTVAETDQGHVPLLVFSDPTIPDRSASILDATAASPLPLLCDYAQRLERAGSTTIVIPCNTAHHYHAAIASSVQVPVLHIADAVIDRLQTTGHQAGAVISVMATAGTLASRFYQERLRESGYEFLMPDSEEQKLIERTIYEIKASRVLDASTLILTTAQSLRLRGASCVVLGCTELAYVRDVVEALVPVVDSTESLALACVKYVKPYSHAAFSSAVVSEPRSASLR